MIGCLLLLSGFFVVVAAMVLMTSFQTKLAFVVAGVAVEVLGLGLLMNSYKSAQKEQK